MENNLNINPKGQISKLKHRYKKPKSKKSLIASIVFILIIIFLIVGFAIYYFLQTTSYMPCSSDKKGSIKESISKDFDINSQEKLKSLSQQIKKQNNYMKDANCLVVLSANEITNNNYDSANNYYEKLQKIKTNSYSLNQVFEQYGILKLSDLKNRIDFIKLQQENIKNNLRFF